MKNYIMTRKILLHSNASAICQTRAGFEVFEISQLSLAARLRCIFTKVTLQFVDASLWGKRNADEVDS